MFRTWNRWFALTTCLMLSTAVLADANQLKVDLDRLQAAKLATDSPALLNFFKKRTLSEETRSQIGKLIELLGASEYATREKASLDLTDLEDLARAQLVEALKHQDPEIRKRARAILTQIGTTARDANLYVPAARVLVARREAEAGRVLLEFLPSIEDPEIAQEVIETLTPLAVDKGVKPNSTFLAALSDPVAIKRTAVGQAFAKSAATRSLARKLLKDADLTVRRRVAVTLVEAGDKTAMPELLNLFAQTTGEDYAVIEDVLLAIAGEKAPEMPSIDTPKSRELYHRQWVNWWKEQGENIALEKIDFAAAYRGYTLLTTLGTRGNLGSVMELDPKGKTRWKIDNLNYPIHVSLVRRDRVLICEYTMNRVIECDLKGNIVWTKTVLNQAIFAERLPNGNTFVVTRNGVFEFNRDGNTVQQIQRSSFDLLAAHRARDGRVTLLTNNGQCIQFDKDGKQTGQFALGRFLGSTIGFRAHFLPGGGLIVPDYSGNKIREYDATGKILWEVNANRPSAVLKLPNGNLLYASRLRNQLVELDKTGREISKINTDGRPLYIERR